MSEINRKRLKELSKLSGNNICADCQQPEPNYASITIGVFICASCVQIHRKLGSHISRTKSLTHDNWDQSNVSFMEDTGNLYAKSLYEKYVPFFYKRPISTDEDVLKEQWIRAKYERKEFMYSLDTIYNKGYMEGFLFKKGKEKSKFNKRRFILSQVDCTLKYYVKDKTPKAVIKVEELNATFCSKKLGKSFSLQLTYPKEGKMRNIFVYAENGKDIVDWYMAIRSVCFQNLRIIYPNFLIAELTPLLPQDFIKEGFLHKTGSKVGDEYKRRWFILYRRLLMYFVEPTNAFAKGEIYLQEKKDGYYVALGAPLGLKVYKYGFTLFTPERKWLFSADTEEDRDDWIEKICQVICTRQIPEDYSVNYRKQMRNSYSYRKSKTSNLSNILSNKSNLKNTNSITSLDNIVTRNSNLSIASFEKSTIKRK